MILIEKCNQLETRQHVLSLLEFSDSFDKGPSESICSAPVFNEN